MCTRFYIQDDSIDLAEIMAAAKASRLSEKLRLQGCALKTSGEIFPSDTVPVIAPDQRGGRAVFPMRWGFRIPGRSLLVNARTETASTLPSFRNSWQKQRCIIPASWYYEWEHFTDSQGKKTAGDKFMIRPEDASVTWLAGLYRIEDGLPVFTVLTKEPCEALRGIHDRMPLLLPGRLLDKWIDPSEKPEELLPYAIEALTAQKASRAPA